MKNNIFKQNLPPVRLFGPVHLLVFTKFPTSTLIWSSAFIRNFRVYFWVIWQSYILVSYHKGLGVVISTFAVLNNFLGNVLYLWRTCSTAFLSLEVPLYVNSRVKVTFCMNEPFFKRLRDFEFWLLRNNKTVTQLCLHTRSETYQGKRGCIGTPEY